MHPYVNLYSYKSLPFFLHSFKKRKMRENNFNSATRVVMTSTSSYLWFLIFRLFPCVLLFITEGGALVHENSKLSYLNHSLEKFLRTFWETNSQTYNLSLFFYFEKKVNKTKIQHRFRLFFFSSKQLRKPSEKKKDIGNVFNDLTIW